MSAEGPLVPKGRERVDDGLDEFQGCSSATPGSLECIQEARERSAKVLRVSVRRRSTRTRRKTHVAEDGPDLPHDRNPLLEQRNALFRRRRSTEHVRDPCIRAEHLGRVKRRISDRDVFFERCTSVTCAQIQARIDSPRFSAATRLQ